MPPGNINMRHPKHGRLRVTATKRRSGRTTKNTFTLAADWLLTHTLLNLGFHRCHKEKASCCGNSVCTPQAEKSVRLFLRKQIGTEAVHKTASHQTGLLTNTRTNNKTTVGSGCREEEPCTRPNQQSSWLAHRDHLTTDRYSRKHSGQWWTHPRPPGFVARCMSRFDKSTAEVT